LCDSLLPALGFRAVAGIALAGMYMPGLQALTHGVEGTIRARIAGWYTSSFTVGASLSFLLSRVGTLLGWRSAFVLAGILSTAAVVIAWAALPRADPGFRKEPKSLNFRPVFANRDALVLIFGYAAAIWGSTGLRQWIVVFLAFCAADQAGVPAQAWIMLAVGALISFLGVPAGLLGNELSIRYGLRHIAALVFLLSALTGGLFGFAAKLPYIAVLCLSVVAGFIVQGNFSNLTSDVLAVADPRHRGATIGLYSCIGFGGGFLGTVRAELSSRRFALRTKARVRTRELLNRAGVRVLPYPAAKGTGAAWALSTSKPSSAARLIPAEIMRTPAPIRSISKPKISGDAACAARAGAPSTPLRNP
jgi:predicted MFS family arabinose efflux permease